MQVDSLMVQDGPTSYYSQVARNVFEDFMTTLRNSTGTRTVTIETGTALRYEYDFYGLLTFMKIPPKYHHTILRVNKFTSPMDYSRANEEDIQHMQLIQIPSNDEMDRIIQAQGATTTIAS
jgi:hypothetical protein